MTSPITTQLRQHPALASLSESGWAALEPQLRFLRFSIGQALSDPDLLPQQVLMVLQGEARLLNARDGQLTSLGKLGPGSVVGLASLLRAAPCEAVTAADDLVAMAISDALVAELYGAEPGFRHWCDTTLFAQELVPLGGELQALIQSCRLVPPQPEAVDAAAAEGLQVVLASGNTPTAIGTPLPPGQPLPVARPPFGLRLIARPAAAAPHPATTNGATAPATTPPLAEATPVVELPQLEEAGPVLASALDIGQDNPSRDLKLIRGSGPLEETLACFQMLSKLLELPFRGDALEKALRDALRRGQTPNVQLCGQLAASLGLHVVGAQVPPEMGCRLQTPGLIPWGDSFAVATDSNNAGLRLASPADGWVQLSPDDLIERFPDGIEVLMMERTSQTPEENFGFTWFLPVLTRYRGALIQVLVASFVVQLFTLGNPLLMQVIVDKVIAQRSFDTLQVLGIALVVVTLMEGVIGSLRTFLFSETTNRIDTRLGAEVIDHLLRLPLNYFDNRPVGELGSRISELEKIRSFLTGQTLTTVLDAAFSVIYIAVMLAYSWFLSIVALIVVPIQIGLTVLGAPLFRRQTRQAANENAKTQSHLVEVLTGIQTVKAQNVELVSRWKWQDFYSRYIDRSFEKMITGVALNETSSVLQKLSQLLVLWVGASMVLSGELSLGQMIAFRIISGYVTSPLLRLSSIYQSIQELKVSFERLADVVDTPEESTDVDKANIPLPLIHGEVQFEDVHFRFFPGAPEVLKSINLCIPAGTFVGVVGQSGSGKSTLTKLLPRLYVPTQGRILIDGYDINKVELYSLRRQIGIVPQEPLLFSGSVSDNIALTDPDAPSEAIVAAARIAAAHDFIMELPSGYSSEVGERGAGLSGGQRQRLAIARTLLSNPKLLVMDEATSALDYDTERRVCDNLRDNLNDCTVFFITHRLSTIRRADLIVMMHQGAIVETGTHEDLMALQGRYYALFRQQEAS